MACGYTDMGKGMQGLAMPVQQVLAEDPFIRGGDICWKDRLGFTGQPVAKFARVEVMAMPADPAPAIPPAAQPAATSIWPDEPP